MSLPRAIEILEAEIGGSPPIEGSTAWWVLRAHALGLSWLRLVRRLQLETPTEGEAHYRASSRAMKTDERAAP